jgi:hypothetical protein
MDDDIDQEAKTLVLQIVKGLSGLFGQGKILTITRKRFDANGLLHDHTSAPWATEQTTVEMR